MSDIGILNRVDVAAFARRGALAFHDRVLLADETHQLTGMALDHVVTVLARDIELATKHPGATVAIQADGLALVLAYWAAIQAGRIAVVVPPDTAASVDSVRFDLNLRAVGEAPRTLVASEVLEFTVDSLLDRNSEQVDVESALRFDRDIAARGLLQLPGVEQPMSGNRDHRAIAYTAAAAAVQFASVDARWLVAAPINLPLLDAVLAGALAAGAPVRIAGDIHAGNIDAWRPTVLMTDLARAHGALAHLNRLEEWGRLGVIARVDERNVATRFAEELQSSSRHVSVTLADDVTGFIATRRAGDTAWQPALGVAFGLLSENGRVSEQPGQEGWLAIRSPQAPVNLSSDVHTDWAFGYGWLQLGLPAQLLPQGLQFAAEAREDPEAATRWRIATERLAKHTQADDVERAALKAGSISLAAFFDRAITYRSDHIALQDGPRSVSYGTLSRRVHALARGLRHHGVARGDRIALLARNRPEFVELYWAANLVGAILVPLNFRLKPGEIAYLLRDSGACVLFHEPEYAPTVSTLSTKHTTVSFMTLPSEPISGAGDTSDYEALIAKGQPSTLSDSLSAESLQDAMDDAAPASILYTAGTTGFPKGAVRTSRNAFWFSMTGQAASARLRPDSTLLLSTPLFHVAGHETLMVGGLIQAAKLIVMRDVNIEQLLDLVDREDIGTIFVPPTIGLDIVRHLRAGSRHLDRLRYWNSASAPLPAVLRDEVVRYLPRVTFRNTLGMTESGVIVRQTFEAGVSRPSNSIGRPLSTVALRLVDQHDHDVAPGQIGEIVIRSPQSITSYWQNEDASRAATAGDWFHTGDLGRLDEHGDVLIMGRLKDMIISGGENVYGTEVENALFSQAGVREAAVFGLAHPRWGEAVVAAIVPEDGIELTEASVIAHCRSLIAHYKAPRRVFFRPQLPKNSTGKVTKFALQSEYATVSWESAPPAGAA